MINDIVYRLNYQEKTIQQLNEQIKIYEKFLEYNNLSIDWSEFCTANECNEAEDFECKDCRHMR